MPARSPPQSLGAGAVPGHLPAAANSQTSLASNILGALAFPALCSLCGGTDTAPPTVQSSANTRPTVRLVTRSLCLKLNRGTVSLWERGPGAPPSTSKFRSCNSLQINSRAPAGDPWSESGSSAHAFSALVHRMFLCLQTACKPNAHRSTQGGDTRSHQTVVPIFSPLLTEKKIPILTHPPAPAVEPCSRKLLSMHLWGTHILVASALSERGCALSLRVCTFKKKQVET